MTGTQTPHQPLPGGSQSAAISNLIVRLLSEYTGRGPTMARTYLNDDLVSVVLRNTLTKGELTLVDNDRGEMVLATRHTFQEVMGAELVAGVEQILQRTVLAFLSANHIEPDIAVETFVLVPSGDADTKSATMTIGRNGA